MSRRVKRGTYRRSHSCGWSGVYETKARADYAKRRHSCDRAQRLAEQHTNGERLRAAVDKTPKPCHHKRTTHEHGTYACYVLDACRCPDCTKAATIYDRDRLRQHAYGRWDNYVDADPVRDHVNALRDAGMGYKRIGQIAGVSGSTMTKLLFGHYAPGPGGRNGRGELLRGPAKRVRKDTAEKILAVQLELASKAIIDGADTARRLQALMSIGWSAAKLGHRLGILPSNMTPLLWGQRPVTVETAKAVHALYVELADTAPPESEHRDKIAAARARNYARTNGWVPPLRINGRLVVGQAVPTEVDTDDEPESLTELDEAAINRRMTGEHSVKVTRAERLELVRRLHAQGLSDGQIAVRTGIHKDQVYRDRSGLGLPANPGPNVSRRRTLEQEAS